jgi:hypothetical protein
MRQPELVVSKCPKLPHYETTSSESTCQYLQFLSRRTAIKISQSIWSIHQ